MSGFPSFFKADYVYNTFYVSIRLSMDSGLLPPFSYCCLRHGCTDIFLRPCCSLFWVHTQEWYCWIIYGYNLKVGVEGSPLELLLPTTEIPGSLWSSLKTGGSNEPLHTLPFLPLPSQADFPLELFFSYPKWKPLFVQQMFISACCVYVWAEGDRQ